MNNKYTGRELNSIAIQSAIEFDPFDYTFKNNITTLDVKDARDYFLDYQYVAYIINALNSSGKLPRTDYDFLKNYSEITNNLMHFKTNKINDAYQVYEHVDYTNGTKRIVELKKDVGFDALMFARNNRGINIDLDYFIRLYNLNNTKNPFLKNLNLPIDTRPYKAAMSTFNVLDLKSIYMIFLAMQKYSKLHVLNTWITNKEISPTYQELLNPTTLLESGTTILLPSAMQERGNLFNLESESYIDEALNYKALHSPSEPFDKEFLEASVKNIYNQLAFYIELIYLLDKLKPTYKMQILQMLRYGVNENNIFSKLVFNPILNTYANEDIEHIVTLKDNNIRYQQIYAYLKKHNADIAEVISNKDKFNNLMSPFQNKFYLLMAQSAQNDYVITFVGAALNLAKKYNINIKEDDSKERMMKDISSLNNEDVDMLEDIFNKESPNYDDQPKLDENLDSIDRRSKVLAPLENMVEKTYNTYDDDIYNFKVKKEINNDQNIIDKYNMIASKVKLVNNILIKNIRKIKTYNEGAKLSGLESGKLDAKNLYKYKTDHKVFTKNKYKIKESDLAIGVLLDVSGSMSGQKIADGKITLIVMHETLKALNINHAIYTHTSNGRLQSTIKEYHSFKESKLYTINKAYSLATIEADGGNCDSGALYYVHKDISRTHNKDKIVIVFSDGEPTECTENQLIQQVKVMEKDGIKVIGIGINLPAIAQYYTDYANGKNLSEMLDIFSRILQEYVLQKAE